MLEQSLILSLIVFFLHVCTWEGHIFHGIHQLTSSWPDKLKKPVYDCPICMTPYWASIFLLLWWAVHLPGTEWIGAGSELRIAVRWFSTLCGAAGFSCLWAIVAKFYSWLLDEEDFRAEQTINIDEAIHRKQMDLDYLKSLKDLSK
jgi:hypothetical protein